MPDNKEEEIPYHSSTPPKISAQSQHIKEAITMNNGKLKLMYIFKLIM